MDNQLLYMAVGGFFFLAWQMFQGYTKRTDKRISSLEEKLNKAIKTLNSINNRLKKGELNGHKLVNCKWVLKKDLRKLDKKKR